MVNPISAQVSLYPLRQREISPVIHEVVALFQSSGLEVEASRMSTVIAGKEDDVFGVVHEAFRRAAAFGDLVMQVTFSNACPLPNRE